jgi:hypothetical protein
MKPHATRALYRYRFALRGVLATIDTIQASKHCGFNTWHRKPTLAEVSFIRSMQG